MLINDRHQKIMELINTRGVVKVNELSELLNVTTETVRQDLNKLEADKMLLRVHGGACSLKNSQSEPYFSEREVINVEQKNEIAKEAVRHIRPYEQISLDSSTTSWFVSKHIPNMPLTVLTNSLRVSGELVGKDKIDVIMLGGILQRRTMGFIGRGTQVAISAYHVNKAFISAKGLHYESGITDSNEATVVVEQEMMNIAKETYLLIDYSKFGHASLIQVAPLSRIDVIITDSNTGDDAIAGLREYAGKVIRAPH